MSSVYRTSVITVTSILVFISQCSFAELTGDPKQYTEESDIFELVSASEFNPYWFDDGSLSMNRDSSDKAKQRAISYAKRAIELVDEFYMPDDGTTASVYHNLGSLYMKLEQYENARQVFEQILTFIQENQNVQRGFVLNEISKIYLHQNEYPKARKLALKVLKLWSWPEKYVVPYAVEPRNSIYYNSAGYYNPVIAITDPFSHEKNS